MANKVSVKEFAAIIKRNRPELVNIADDVLVNKALLKKPHLRERIDFGSDDSLLRKVGSALKPLVTPIGGKTGEVLGSLQKKKEVVEKEAIESQQGPIEKQVVRPILGRFLGETAKTVPLTPQQLITGAGRTLTQIPQTSLDLGLSALPLASTIGKTAKAVAKPFLSTQPNLKAAKDLIQAVRPDITFKEGLREFIHHERAFGRPSDLNSILTKLASNEADVVSSLKNALVKYKRPGPSPIAPEMVTRERVVNDPELLFPVTERRTVPLTSLKRETLAPTQQFNPIKIEKIVDKESELFPFIKERTIQSPVLPEPSKVIHLPETLEQLRSVERVVTKNGEELFIPVQFIQEVSKAGKITKPFYSAFRPSFRQAGQYFGNIKNYINDKVLVPARKAEVTIRELHNTDMNNFVKETGIKKGSTAAKELRSVVEKAAPATSETVANGAVLLRRKFTELLAEVNRARFNIGKKPIPVRQDYVTQAQELSVLDDVFGIENVASTDDLLSLSKSRPGTPAFQSELRRAGSMENITEDALEALEGYSYKARRFVYNAELTKHIRDLAKYSREVGRDDIATFIDDIGHTTSGKIHPLDSSLVKAGSVDAAGYPINVYNLVEKFASHLARKYIEFSPKTILQQPSSLAMVAGEVSWTSLAKNLVRSLRPSVKAYVSGISPAVNAAGSEITDLSSLGTLTTIGKKASDTYFSMLKEADKTVKIATWLSGFSRAQARGKSVLEAAREAEDLVLRTQGTGLAIDRPPILASRGMRAFMPLSNYLFTLYNNITNDYKVKSVKDTIRLAKLVASVGLTTAVYKAVLGFNPLTITSAIPFLGNVKYGSVGPITDLTKIAGTAMKDVETEAQKEGKIKKIKKDVVNLGLTALIGKAPAQVLQGRPLFKKDK